MASAKPVLHLSPCARSYARARLDPFNTNESELPCIPDLYDIPSFKFCSKNRGVCSIGTGGIGYVAVAPNVFSNNGVYLASTSNSLVSVNLTFTNPTTGVTFTPDVKFPWSSTNPRLTRCVAMGLRVRYTGTQLNLGGRTILHNNPGTFDYQARQVNEITTEPSAVVHPCTRMWKGVVWNPSTHAAYEYSDDATKIISSTSASNIGLVALFEGTPGNTYEFEVVRYFEACDNATASGTFPVPSTSKSHSDVVGLGLVKDFLASETAAEIGNGLLNRFTTFASNGAAAAASSYFAPSGPRIEWM